ARIAKTGSSAMPYKVRQVGVVRICIKTTSLKLPIIRRVPAADPIKDAALHTANQGQALRVAAYREHSFVPKAPISHTSVRIARRYSEPNAAFYTRVSKCMMVTDIHSCFRHRSGQPPETTRCDKLPSCAAGRSRRLGRRGLRCKHAVDTRD